MSIHLLTDLLTYKIIPEIKMKYKNNSSTNRSSKLPQSGLLR